MTDISRIESLRHWKLLAGSHDWPGPDGGTCINEAAIVAAGFKYNPVGGPEDFPSCFSKELGVLLLSLNDALSDERRQALMRFVLRLPGSRDTAKVERRRCRFLHDALRELLPRHGIAIDELPARLRSSDERRAFAEQWGETIGLSAEYEVDLKETDQFLDAVLGIIGQAFAIGRQAPPVASALIEARMARARKLQPA